jgi:hypothetical protein
MAMPHSGRGESPATVQKVDEKSPTPDRARAADKAQAAREREAPPIGGGGGFANDPPDPTNPNEVIERHRRKLRPKTG